MTTTELYIYSFKKDDASGFAGLIRNVDVPSTVVNFDHCTNSKTYFRLQCLTLLTGLKKVMTEITINKSLPPMKQLVIYSNFDINKLFESLSKDKIFTDARLLYSKFEVNFINIKDIKYTDEITKVNKAAWYIATHPDTGKFIDCQYDKPNRPTV